MTQPPGDLEQGLVELEVVLPEQPGDRWDPGAVARLVGQRLKTLGGLGVVAAAWLDEDGAAHVRLRTEPPARPDLAAADRAARRDQHL